MCFLETWRGSEGGWERKRAEGKGRTKRLHGVWQAAMGTPGRAEQTIVPNGATGGNKRSHSVAAALPILLKTGLSFLALFSDKFAMKHAYHPTLLIPRKRSPSTSPSLHSVVRTSAAGQAFSSCA